MENYRLTKKADLDLSAIYEYGLLTFGITQAQSYLLGLHDRFDSLSENPMMGRSAAQFEPKLRCFEYQKHVVFYLPDDSSILIVRVLRVEMDFNQHL